MIKKWRKFNEEIGDPNGVSDDVQFTTEHDIQFDGQGVGYYEHQTEVSFIIDGQDYMFTLYEKGQIDGKVDSTDFISDSELPFELTQEMKDEMYDLYANQ